MGNILQSLKVSAVKRDRHQSPVVARRNKLLNSIHQQIEAAKAKEQGQQYLAKRLRRVRNQQGERVETVHNIAIRESWWVADDGKVYVEVRYGYKPLEITKGKTSIEVGDWSNLIPTLSKLRMAVEAGEFDSQLTEAFSRLANQLKGRHQNASN